MKKNIVWFFYMLATMLLLQACTVQNKIEYDIIDNKSNNIEMSYLKDLLFEGYENLSVDEYRNRLMYLFDSKEPDKYETFFLDIENNDDYLNLRELDTDEYYLFNVILPTVSKDWLNRRVNAISSNGAYEIEWSINYSILDPKNITIKERDYAIRQVYNSINSLINEFSIKSYGLNEMEFEFDRKINSLIKKLSDNDFAISVEGVCRIEDDIVSQEVKNKNRDKSTKLVADKESYHKLLLLNTEDMSNKTLSDFLEIYVKNIQSEDFKEAQRKVFQNIVENNIPSYLTEEEVRFLTVTLEATSKEFIALYHEKKENVTLEYRIDNTNAGENSKSYSFFMNYQIVYLVSDNTKYRIKDRDNCITGIRNSIESYIDNKTKEELNGNSEAIQKFLDELSSKYSNDDIRFEIMINSYNVE